MARMARFVVPGCPHHVTQRGVRRMRTFLVEEDYGAYLTLLAESCAKAGTEVWAYCLMPNHVHLILVPATPDGLRAALGEAHRRYTRRINFREDCQGHLWQERFHSFAMDEKHLLACARYVELNPVRAGLVARPQDWNWSSARAHLAGRDDSLVQVGNLLQREADWSGLLQGGLAAAERDRFHLHTSTGRPLGARAWLEQLERQSGKTLRPKSPGRPRTRENANK